MISPVGDAYCILFTVRARLSVDDSFPWAPFCVRHQVYICTNRLACCSYEAHREIPHAEHKRQVHQIYEVPSIGCCGSDDANYSQAMTVPLRPTRAESTMLFAHLRYTSFC